ncbi:MAG: Oligoendopeptidase F, plasmid [Calditrichaeota bacterium]|nr:Oligoendopeptidase F, plasmid [Calditrichota bacterium]
MAAPRRILLAALMLLLAAGAFAQKPETLNRDEIPGEYKWNLSDIYEDWETWEADKAEIESLMEQLKTFKGRLAEGPDVLADMYLVSEKLGMLAERWASYVWLQAVVDQKNQELKAKQQEMQILFARFSQAMAWVDPEILNTIPEKTMQAWLKENDVLGEREFKIMELYRQQEHVLDEDGEYLLSLSSQLRGNPSNTYSSLSTADVEFPEVVLANGDTVKATHGTYAASKETYRNQEDRKKVFKAHFSTFDDFENTYASILDGMLQSNWYMTQAREYESSAQMHLDDNNIPVEVMANMIETAKAGVEPLRRFNQIRKQVLGLERYRYFDMYIPLVEIEWPFYYDNLKPNILSSLEPFGGDYVGKAKRAFEEGWFDVYEAEGKRSGAFSSGVYGVHPYMMLNHADTMNDAFTLAHELGHTMHTVLSDETQPYHSKQYSIFVAEIASTMGEHFFLDYLLETTDDPDKRIALLEHAINTIHGTFYRQLMFADFEYKMHKAVQNGQPITAQTLQQMYLESLNAFFGDSLDDQDWYRNTWARIPHFQRPFYVYQYATSIAASSLIYDRITNEQKYSENERKQALDDYLTLLSSGGDDYPMEQCRKAGVDFTTPVPGEAMVARMTELVDKLEAELEKKGMLGG